MDIGEHCVSCGQLDFLPFQCNKCGHTFCGSHRMHDCVAEQKQQRQEQQQQQKSVTKEASKPSSVPAQKPAPKSEPKNQGAKPPQRLNKPPAGPKPGKERAIAALERFKQLVGANSRPQTSRVSPVSLEMKRKAVGDSSVPATNRAYFMISRPPQPYKDPLTNKEAMRPSKEISMFFDKTHSAGQLLDRASKQLGVHGKALHCGETDIDLKSKISELVQGSALTITI